MNHEKMVIVCVLAWMTTHTHFVKNRRELTMNVPREEGLDFDVVVNNASMVNGSVVCPRDSQCHFLSGTPVSYVDAAGNTYDFAFGMNWGGVIDDARTQKYTAEPLTKVSGFDFGDRFLAAAAGEAVESVTEAATEGMSESVAE